MKKIFYLFILLFTTYSALYTSQSFAQTTILIYQQDFESTSPPIALNAYGPGKNYGINKWTINNKYNGAPLYPNTPDQNQTSGGSISFAPEGHYLHIYDENADLNNGIGNCNYNPADSSDRFAQLSYGTDGFCTLGITNVKIAFFYIGMGSGTAHAELYYSAGYGPWIKTGTIYNNQPVWKYEVVQNPAFDNNVNLRFGFRWVNDDGSSSGTTSIGIDDIFIKGDFDNFETDFNLIIDSIKPNPVCQNLALSIHYHLTVPICGEGYCLIVLSDATGSFTTPTSLGLFILNNQEMTGVFTPNIPADTPPGTCYKVKMDYYYVFYGLDFFTPESKCFEVKHCPNTITTLQPLVTKSAPDSLCIGSVIDVSFFSTGVYQTDNNYIAQLSDSAGNFPANPNILGESADKKSYDPDAGSSPGAVSGVVNEVEHLIPNGCNYYIRIISTNPVSIGEVFGPFCIKHCDIETNHRKDIQACVHDCRTSPEGFNSTIYAKIHKHDSTSVYDASNQFKIEVLDNKFLKPIDPVGALGKITATNDTTFRIHIPCVDSLGYLGLKPGMYYMRIIGTNSNHSYNLNGTLIRLIIGAPADELFIFQDPPDSVFCIGDAVYFLPIPFNDGPPMNSTYQWFFNDQLYSSEPAIGILLLGVGKLTLTVQETNNGCQGPLTANAVSINIIGPPSAKVTGPKQICLGDTIHYSVPFEKNVYYEWKSSGGTLIDTSNNLLNIRYDTEGIYVVDVKTLNKCGQTPGSINVIATAHPDAHFALDSKVCSDVISIITPDSLLSSPNIYKWNFDGGVANPGGNNPGPQKVSWDNPGKHKVMLTVSKNGCATADSNFIDVIQSPKALFNFKNQCLGSTSVFNDSSKFNPIYWKWNFGDGDTISFKQETLTLEHVYNDAGDYFASLIVTSANGCKDTVVDTIAIYKVPSSEFTKLPTVCYGEKSLITYSGNAPSDATYTWNFANGKVLSGSGQGPYEIQFPEIGTFNVMLSISQNGCNSSSSDTVKVEECKVTIPDIFTPNNDGKNDFFHIKGIENFPKSNLRIFNRWGDKILDIIDYKNDWNGDKHPDGVYFYILDLNNGTIQKGNVTIIK